MKHNSADDTNIVRRCGRKMFTCLGWRGFTMILKYNWLRRMCFQLGGLHMHLVAPYCAIPRDYLSDTPLLRAMGFLASQHGQLGAIPPPLFLSDSPLGEHAKWRCDTPPQKGYLSDTGAIPYENKANGCDTPLCDTISKGYCAIGGGISHWAAKHMQSFWATQQNHANPTQVVVSGKPNVKHGN